MNSIPELFGSMVFNDAVMQERLPNETYLAIKKTIEEGRSLDISVATVVANAMKDWAIEKGATHFTHWFQPMTGITAEKHDSFLTPNRDGTFIMEFSGKELIKGESDASSFPSGGLRATFEARGYTAWDPTSYAFIKDNSLCIPTAFCSYGGEALDKKTPLLRSMEALNRQAMRIMRLFGHDEVKRVSSTVGPEQEYFLIDKSLCDRRKDIIFTGRTLFGARPPKGQEMDDHYYGTIKPGVAAFMKDINEEFWRLGIPSKTEHNEAAPSQHEMAPIFATTNIACDHDQLVMEIMQKVAKKHDLVCLLHEKPFAGLNGSGKHNNWSLSTDTGINLLEPGDTPFENAQFLLFFCAVIKAVDEYQDLLRLSVASAGNDLRLGANEAPPAVISIFVGDELNEILDSLEHDTAYDPREKVQMRIGVHVLPKFPRDTTDRNRTSPLAFTGNKFEFRMLGASSTIADVNIVLNTIVAESLRSFAEALENTADFKTALHDLIRDTIRQHRRIIFNGNGYDQAWIKEATEQRGLLNLPTTPDCLPRLITQKSIDLFTSHRVFSESELRSRYEIMLEQYCKILHIEALTMIDMTKQDILPAVCSYQDHLADAIRHKKEVAALGCEYEIRTLSRSDALSGELFNAVTALEEAVDHADGEKDLERKADYYRDVIRPEMRLVREKADALEQITDKKFWPMPTYSELLFRN